MSKTATHERVDVAEPAVGKGQIAVLHPARLPFHQLIEDRFGVDRASWKALTEAIYPNAKTTDSVVMALSYCRARKLDPFKRPVHIVPMWSTAAGGMVETVWPGISELRTTAFRTGQYAGKTEAEFGPSVERTFKGTFQNKSREVSVTFPEWGRVTVKRILQGEERVFVSPKVYWMETYGRWGNTDVPNDMWAKRPFGQLEKCIEAAGLRCAFPEEIGNDYAAEEMEGRAIDAPDVHRSESPAGAKPVNLAGALDKLAELPVSDAPPIDAEVEEVHEPEQQRSDAATGSARSTKKTTAASEKIPNAANEPDVFLQYLDTKLATFTDYAAMEAYWNENIRPLTKSMFPPDQAEANKLWDKHARRLGE